MLHVSGSRRCLLGAVVVLAGFGLGLTPISSASAECPAERPEDAAAQARAFLESCLLLPSPRARHARADAALEALVRGGDPATLRGGAGLLAAAALGVRARTSRLLESARRGDARVARRLLDGLLASDPSSAWATAFSAAWHLEAVRRGGAMAQRLYGASAAVGVAQAGDAVRRGGGDPDLRLLIAVSLLSSDAEAHQATASDLLARPCQRSRVVAEAAAELSAALRLGPREAHRAALKLI